ncbi:MOSC domain-containing protein [Plantactinospora sp. GCM10030261]|uniref:MOSC domain-containing protein n=1 Tax=Plantactinospora sp. GCM10030261 TaxID=3273420 RepID=UPI003611316F
MYVAQLWRYPVKSLRGERLTTAELTADGITGDRILHLRDSAGLITARSHSGLLGLSARTTPSGQILVEGLPWQDPATARAIRHRAGEDAELVRYTGSERFDVLPLSVITDGAVAVFGSDVRRLRPNIVIGGVQGLAERDWPGRALRIGEVTIGVLKLRARCVVTTVDPDTGQRDPRVLRRLHRDFDGRFALDCWSVGSGTIHVGDPVRLVDAPEPRPRPGGWIVGAPYTVP